MSGRVTWIGYLIRTDQGKAVRYLKEALTKCGGNVFRCAELLGVDHSGLCRILVRLGMHEELDRIRLEAGHETWRFGTMGSIRKRRAQGAELTGLAMLGEEDKLRAKILEAIEQAEGNMLKVAALLSVSPRTAWNYVDHCKLRRQLGAARARRRSSRAKARRAPAPASAAPRASSTPDGSPKPRKGSAAPPASETPA